MATTGILLHVYNLGCNDWEQLVWGEPEQDQLGTGAKLFECLMAEPAEHAVQVVLYDGPSHKAGVSEGEYTRRFLQDKLNMLSKFPKLKTMYNELSTKEKGIFHDRVMNLRLGEPIANTYDEICSAARYFDTLGAVRVLHIAAASHAPRCIQLQARAREAGLIPAGQLWYTVASDLAFAGHTASDTVVLEPPHRADDPLLHHHPSLPELLKSFYKLPLALQVEIIESVDQTLHSTAKRPDSAPHQ